MSQDTAEVKLLRAILDKLEKIEKLQALQAVKGTEKELDKIDLLDSLGFRPVEIARLLNKSEANVSVVLSRRKKALAPTPAPQQQAITPPVVVAPPAQT